MKFLRNSYRCLTYSSELCTLRPGLASAGAAIAGANITIVHNGWLLRHAETLMPLSCFIYASRKKPDTYLWLTRRDNFDALPAQLRAMTGELRFVMELQLDETRRLPREDTATVLANDTQAAPVSPRRLVPECSKAAHLSENQTFESHRGREDRIRFGFVARGSLQRSQGNIIGSKAGPGFQGAARALLPAYPAMELPIGSGGIERLPLRSADG